MTRSLFRGVAVMAVLLAFDADIRAAEPTVQEAAVLDLVNAERAAAGVAPLAWDDTLARLALTQAAELAQSGTLTHESPVDGATYAQRVARSGLLVRETAENAAVADDGPDAHAQFMDSPRHRDNVLDGALTDVGIGIVADPSRDGVVVIEDFARIVRPIPDDAASALLRRLIAVDAPGACEDTCLDAEAERLVPLMAERDTERLPGPLLVAHDFSVGYTTPDPGDVPAMVRTLVQDVRDYGIAVTFRVTPKHRIGTYFVALLMRRRM